MPHISDEKSTTKRELTERLDAIKKKARTAAIKDRAPFKGLQIKPTASIYDEAPSREPGEGNWSKFGFDVHPQVTISSSLILIAFIAVTIIFKDESALFFKDALAVITQKSGWFFILSANIFIIACLFFAFSKLGKVKIGGNKATPEFSTPAWYAMLLSAGMGIGLMFWSVGEPMFHFNTPSPMFDGVTPGSPAAAQAAMGVTFFHWGIHPWAIYALVGLSLAYFSFNRGLPLTIRSIFYPLLGDKIYGFWGNLIDTLSVIATFAGLATSLGFGAKQVNAGLNALFGLEITSATQVSIIAVITLAATLSVMTGLDKGVKYLSSFNMGLAGLFMLFVLIVGPTAFLLSGLTQNLGFYFSEFTQLSLWTETFKDSNWQGSWTVFYWAWWISWSPFVGMFIARISKGRTVKEFITGVIIVPSLLSFVWMSVFGGSALFMELKNKANIVEGVQENVSTALFVLLESFPASGLLSAIAMLLVIIFFVTSSDSGSLVVDHLTSGGKLDSPAPQRVFWAVMEGVLAAALLLGGGLQTLQTASICAGLPFAFIILISIYSLYIGLTQEVHVEESVTEKIEEFELEQLMENFSKEKP